MLHESEYVLHYDRRAHGWNVLEDHKLGLEQMLEALCEVVLYLLIAWTLGLLEHHGEGGHEVVDAV